MARIILPFDDVEFKSADAGDDAGTFEGYGAAFGNVDFGNDICVKGCFSKSIEELTAKGKTPGMYWQHDSNEPIGDWLSVKEDARGLKVKGRPWIGKGIGKAEQAYMMLRGNGPKGLSIGYTCKQSTWDDRKKIRSLVEVDIKEVSIVSFPMNEKAVITAIKSALEDGQLPSVRDLETVLRDGGLSAKQAKALISGGYKALTRDAEVSDPLLEMVQNLRQIITTR